MTIRAKSKWVVLAVALCSLTLQSCIIGKSKVLSPLAQYPSEVNIRVPKATLKTAGAFDGDARKVLGKINSVEIFSSKDRRSFPAIERRAGKIPAEAEKMELLIEVTDSCEQTEIYGLASDKGNAIKKMLIKTTEPGECTVIYIKGNIDFGAMIDQNKNDFHTLKKLFR